MHRGYTTPLVIAIMAFAIVAFLFLIDTAINPDGSKKTTNTVVVNKNTNEVACTMEAKICPDGSAVGRSGPKCEFAECPTPTNTNSTTNQNTNATADPTAGWNTYTNETYKYSLKYPETYAKITTPNGDVSVRFDKGKENSAGYQFLTVSVISATSDTGTAENSIYEWARDGFSFAAPITAYHQNPRREKLGEETYVVTDGDRASSAIPEYLLYKNNLLYHISSYAGNGTQASNRELIATMTFPDPTAGWKTYTNTTHGYSIQYPPDWPLDSKKVSAVTIGTVPFEPGPGSLLINVHLNKTIAQRVSELKSNYIDGCLNETSNQFAGSLGQSFQCRGAFAGELNEFTLVAKGTSTYELTYVSGSTTTDPILKQILPTFAFTD